MATALNTIVAAVLAVLITLGVVRQEPGYAGEDSLSRAERTRVETDANRREGFATSSLAMPAAGERPGAQAPAQVIRLQAVGSPEEPLRLEPNRPGRIPIVLEPEAARRDGYILVLSGLPPGSGLTGAERISSDSWLLTPDAMTRLSLTIPEWSASLFEVVIELRRMNGAFAAESRAWLMVPPPAMAKASRSADQAALKDLLDRSGQLLARGDVVAARTLYERAADMGSGAAALALGSTYDPSRLWSLGVFGMVGNKERARQWYARAEQLGHPEAKERLRALGD
jgi:hypothetical protein